MKIHPVVFLFVVAVFNGASCAAEDDKNWAWVMGEDGKLEIFNSRLTREDSSSSLSELKEKVKFKLFTNSNPEEGQIISLDDDDAFKASNFDVSKPTRFIIHGWNSNPAKASTTLTRDAYFSKGEFNIIAVDWSEYSNNLYTYARTKIVTTGEFVGMLIDDLVNKGMNIEDLIVIGHSLGAHVAGVACRNAKKNVPILIALDPAGLLFYVINESARLRSTDADFVQVIHTNAGVLGHSSELGDVDIWPNGGTWQSGCNFDVVGYCSHQRSYRFFAESISISNPQFVAYKCDDYSSYEEGSCARTNPSYLGGLKIDTSVSGNYYLQTNSDSTYAQGY